MANAPFNPMDSLIFLTIRVGKLLINGIRKDKRMEASGVQLRHMSVLVDLWSRDGVRQQDLASSSIKDKASITRVITDLESLSILVRTPDSADKRTKRIYLTYKGKAMKEKLKPVAQLYLEHALRNIDPQEIETCKKVLMKMYENLHN